MERDIIERLMDFERCGLTAGERVNLRECAAVEIHQLRQENEKYRKTLEIIAGSAEGDPTRGVSACPFCGSGSAA